MKGQVITMIPIINNSKELDMEFDKYRDTFSKPQFRHFSSYCTGLILQEKQFTINSINKLFVDENNSRDQSSLNRFFKKSPWDEEALTHLRQFARFWRQKEILSTRPVKRTHDFPGTTFDPSKTPFRRENFKSAFKVSKTGLKSEWINLPSWNKSSCLQK